MRPDEQHDPVERGPGGRAGRFGLFYFEQVGSRHYLRFTRLALLLIVCLTLISILLLFTFYLSRKRSGPREVDVDIVVPTPVPRDYNKPIIQPAAPPPTPPKVSRRPGVGASPRQTPLAPNGNANGSFTPSPTPPPTLARPPT
jgi:hypothetical protein